ncbi:lipoprotein [Wenzhouxiangella sp. AB-CW3]|nr:lipoprotein [Wenzhouxiangella sp. AB-CW3]QOC23649.1 lipoprotein [Wenzhouxiangella sp. AB-CW3]
MRSSLTCLLLSLALLTGCGLKGDLYLPPDDPVETETDTSEEETDETGA